MSFNLLLPMLFFALGYVTSYADLNVSKKLTLYRSSTDKKRPKLYLVK